jgi:hypothetical protein
MKCFADENTSFSYLHQQTNVLRMKWDTPHAQTSCLSIGCVLIQLLPGMGLVVTHSRMVSCQIMIELLQDAISVISLPRVTLRAHSYHILI